MPSVPKIGIVGCGFVADYYLATLQHYPNLKITGVMDSDRERALRFSRYYGLRQFPTLSDLLSDSNVDLVLNLTNPRSHYAISRAAIEAGKHVYSEKPLGMTMEEATHLVDLAKQHNRRIASAPCNLLGESCQTLWKAIRDQLAGSVRLVYCELDDGPIYKMSPENWQSVSGTPWPAKDEYEVGCTFEHAGYYLSWLIAFFGPVESLTASSHQLIESKGINHTLFPSDTPDFSVACLKFASGVIARLTCSITAPHDHSLKVVGDRGVLSVDECWHYGDPVRYFPFSSKAFRAAQYGFIRNNSLLKPLFGLRPKKVPFVRNPGYYKRFTCNYMDYARGVEELAQAIVEERECRLSPELGLHINEIICALHDVKGKGGFHKMATDCHPIQPMPWAV